MLTNCQNDPISKQIPAKALSTSLLSQSNPSRRRVQPSNQPTDRSMSNINIQRVFRCVISQQATWPAMIPSPGKPSWLLLVRGGTLLLRREKDNAPKNGQDPSHPGAANCWCPSPLLLSLQERTYKMDHHRSRGQWGGVHLFGSNLDFSFTAKEFKNVWLNIH